MREIINLKTQKNFYFGLLLSLKFMFMSASLITYGYIVIMSDVTWASNIYETTAFIWVAAILCLFFGCGKQIIQVHIKAFDWIDLKFRQLLDRYSIWYWKKHKKDAPILSSIQKWGYKLFGFYYKLSPKRRKILMISLLVGYGTYFIGLRFVDDLALFIDGFI